MNIDNKISTAVAILLIVLLVAFVYQSTNKFLSESVAGVNVNAQSIEE